MEKYQLKRQTVEEIQNLREYVRGLGCISMQKQYDLLRALNIFIEQQQENKKLVDAAIERPPYKDDLLRENEQLKQWVNDLQSGMYVNCVYCGYRYGHEKDTPASMADILKKHIEQCPKPCRNGRRNRT